MIGGDGINSIGIADNRSALLKNDYVLTTKDTRPYGGQGLGLISVGAVEASAEEENFEGSVFVTDGYFGTMLSGGIDTNTGWRFGGNMSFVFGAEATYSSGMESEKETKIDSALCTILSFEITKAIGGDKQ
ncbi:MAG: hypothetical protein ACQEQ4_10830 [Fibrobacterota bacterium]